MTLLELEFVDVDDCVVVGSELVLVLSLVDVVEVVVELEPLVPLPSAMTLKSVPYHTLVALLPNWPSNQLPSEFGKLSKVD